MSGRRAALFFHVGFLLLTASAPTAEAQRGDLRVIPPGREGVILDAVERAFGDEPVDEVRIDRGELRALTGEGPALVGTANPGVSVELVCAGEGDCDAEAEARWAPVAARLESELDAHVDEIWVRPMHGEHVAMRPREPGAGEGDAPRTESLAPPRSISWLLLLVVAVGLAVAPRKRPAGSRKTLRVALLSVLAFFVAALTISPPRPLHDHLSFLTRSACAATLHCDVAHHAWGQPSFHLMGLLLQCVPERLPWILGLGVGVTAIALFFAYDVTVRLGARMGLGETSGKAGLWALACVALHPGFLRLAGTGSFWPLTLLLLFISLHLVLRAASGHGSRQAFALFAAGAALALVLGGNRLVLVLCPLVFLAPWAWKAGPWWAGLLASVVPLAMFSILAPAVLDQGAYTGEYRLEPIIISKAIIFSPVDGALTGSFTTPLILLGTIVALASRRRLRDAAPLAFAFFTLAAATIFVVGPLRWSPGYPDAYLKHFPQLLLSAPLFGIGAVITVTFVAARAERFSRFVVPVAATAFLLTVWTRPDAVGLLFTERVMEREVRALQRAFDVLPPHARLVISDVQVPPEGIDPRGDPLRMEFPTGMYYAALDGRGHPEAELLDLDVLLSGDPPGDRTLLYVGSTLRTFYAAEVEERRVPPSRERPALERVRERYALEPAEVFRLPTEEPAGWGNPVAPGADEVELGFYWVLPLEPDRPP